MKIKELLQTRRIVKGKKPRFLMQDSHKKSKLAEKWRKPRGSDSKMRIGKKGYRRTVRVGWGSPSAVKGFDMNGLLPVRIMRPDDLEGLDPKINSLVIGSSVGAKNKMAIIEKALAANFNIESIKDPKKLLDNMKERAELKKKQKDEMKTSRQKKKEDNKKAAEKKAKEQKKKEQDTAEESEEDKKLEQKKEQDKVLISSQ